MARPTAAAILSAEHAGDPYRQARFVLLTTAAEATSVAGAIGNNVIISK
jgi:hypothetical protein